MREDIADFDAATIIRRPRDNTPYEDPARLNRQRGLWQFLTRYFFLGNIIAFEQLLISNAAHSSPSDDLFAQHGDKADTSSAASGYPVALDDFRSVAEDGASPRPDVAQAEVVRGEMPPAGHSADVAAPFRADGETTSQTAPKPADASGSDAAYSGADSANGTGDADAPSQVGGGDGVLGNLDSIDIGLDLGHGVTAHVGLGTLLDVNVDVSSTLDAIAPPLLAVVDDAVAPIIDTTLAPVTDILTNTVSASTETLATVINGASTLLNQNAAPDVGTDGSISLASEPMISEPLFADSHYTQLNIVAHSLVGGDLMSDTAGSVASDVDALLVQAHDGGSHSFGHLGESGLGSDHGLLSELNRLGHEFWT